MFGGPTPNPKRCVYKMKSQNNTQISKSKFVLAGCWFEKTKGIKVKFFYNFWLIIVEWETWIEINLFMKNRLCITEWLSRSSIL